MFEYATVEQLRRHRIKVTQTAIVRADLSDACQSCGVQKAPIGDGKLLQKWLVSDANDLGNTRHITGAMYEIRNYVDDCEKYRTVFRNILLIEKSKLSAAIAIPDRLLFPIYPRLSDEEKRFLTNDFVIAICQVCRESPHAEKETTDSIMRRYLKSLSPYVDLSSRSNHEILRGGIEYHLREQLKYESNGRLA